MHPLETYLVRLERRSETRAEYRANVARLAREVGVSPKMFHRMLNPRQDAKISAEKALRLELATGGVVPASSVCNSAERLLGIAVQVSRLRNQKQAEAA